MILVALSSLAVALTVVNSINIVAQLRARRIRRRKGSAS